MRFAMMGGGASGKYYKNTQTKTSAKENEFSGKNFLVKDVLKTYSFLNANLYYQQKDSKWEFKISANNLTNNTSMNTDSYNEITDGNTTSLHYFQPRLYLFSVKYNL